MKKRCCMMSVVGFAVAAVVAQFAAGGTVRYVSPSGTEAGGYTNWETAAKTVAKAVNACNHGDVIFVSNSVTSASSQVVGTNGSPGASVSQATPSRVICVFEVTVSRLRQPNGGAPQLVARVGEFHSAQIPQLADVEPQGTPAGAVREGPVRGPGVAVP